MTYHGITLSITFARHTDGHRYTYVSDEKGFPIESIGSIRHDRLCKIRDQEQGWKLLGTWPVGKHPKDVWEEDPLTACG